MRINYTLDKNNRIIGWSSYPLNETLPIIDVDSPDDIKLGFDKVENGIYVKNIEEFEAHMIKAKEINNIEIKILQYKKLLSDSDYKLYKFLDGALTESEYAPIREQRQSYRNKINELELQLAKLQ